MRLKTATILSLIVHCGIIFVLTSGFSWSFQQHKKSELPIEARLLIKTPQRKKELLPRKKSAPPSPSRIEKIQPPKKNEATKKKPAQSKKVAPVAKKISKAPRSAQKKVVPKKEPNYSKTLESFSESFVSELASQERAPESPEPNGEPEYFDRVYTLIKESFVLPPHLNGPAGKGLKAIVKIFVASDGALIKVELVRSSGDAHFDKAVLDGTRRVTNFGVVPLLLQNSLREHGIVVELCPFTCNET